ncbi:NAD(P)-dependent oxidoreductase [Herbiconiux sp. P16]|uniref:NAD(P)-dependent oxidoreductase n=1 Tax=Herbiconiux wuyangfengii TaxID=3342794 RepID=UPI0035B97D4F
MNTVIFGANGATGRLLIDQALEHGREVTAAVRNPSALDRRHPRLTIARVDVLDAGQVSAALDNARADAVVSSLGVPFGRDAIDLYSRGTANIVAAMTAHGVRRLLVTSSSAADPAVRFKNSGGGVLMEALKPLVIFVMGRTTYTDMRRMEELVAASGLDFTIVRPSGLFDADAVSDYRVEESHVRGAFTARIDLANFMITALTDRAWFGRAAAIATTSGTPRVLDFFRAEALK